MTRVLGMFVLALLLAPLPARAGELTLRDVIELHRTGLGEELLIAVIEADGGPFTLGFADIQDLKSDGLSERVIAALVRTGTRRSQAAGEAPVVAVEQHVTTVVPVVVGSALSHDDGQGRHHAARGSRGDGRNRGRDPGQREPFDHKVELPAATWITRQGDGGRVAPKGSAKTDRPAATWVTPNEPRAESRRDDADAPPARRDDDRRSRPPR